MSKYTPVNDNVVIRNVNLKNTLGMLMPDDVYSGKQWETAQYNIEVGEVISSDKFKVGSKVFFSRGISEPINSDFRCVKTYRVWGYYEEGI